MTLLNLLGLFEHVKDAETFESGDLIFQEGTPGDIMYVILEGKVDISVHGRTVDIANPGELVGEMALIDSKSRSATAIAKTDCTLAPVDQSRFLFMVQETPMFSLHVMQALVDRLRRVRAKG